MSNSLRSTRICPNDVRLTLEQAIPGGMYESLEDYSLMREVGFIRDFALVWAAWRFSSRIAALARRPSGRFADFSEIGVHAYFMPQIGWTKGGGVSNILSH